VVVHITNDAIGRLLRRLNRAERCAKAPVAFVQRSEMAGMVALLPLNTAAQLSVDLQEDSYAASGTPTREPAPEAR
jgi:hypothetical protein